MGYFVLLVMLGAIGYYFRDDIKDKIKKIKKD